MSLGPRDLKTVGSAAGLILFFVPLLALYLYIRSWRQDLDPALVLGTGPEKPAHVAPKAPAPDARSPDRISRPGPTHAVSGPVRVSAERASRTTLKVTFTNMSGENLVLAVPRHPGGLVRIFPKGKEPPVRRAPAYDPATDMVMTLWPGGAFAHDLDHGRALPGGTLTAVYDSRDPSVPGGAWRGRVEVEVAGGLDRNRAVH